MPFLTCAFIPESSKVIFLQKAGLLTCFIFCAFPFQINSGVEIQKTFKEAYSIG